MKITERGWAGHFICADRCRFRRNTLIAHDAKSIVVSTVGNFHDEVGMREIGYKRWYETMVFRATEENGYMDADVGQELGVDSESAINGSLRASMDQEANDMHEAVVLEFVNKLGRGAV